MLKQKTKILVLKIFKKGIGDSYVVFKAEDEYGFRFFLPSAVLSQYDFFLKKIAFPISSVAGIIIIFFIKRTY